MPSAGRAESGRPRSEASLARLEARAWRVVEAQHVVSTRKLVDSAAEQEILEELIERAKPPVPTDPGFAGLHYLLSTPFRYPPLRYGSRFGTRAERGIWYGARGLPTALAEAAYYRLVFLAGTEAELEPIRVDLTAFRAGLATERGAELVGRGARAWGTTEVEVSSPVSYTASQRTGAAMRAAGVEAFRFRSARDPAGGDNFGVLDPAAFARRSPEAYQTWYCVAAPEAVEMSRRPPARPVHRLESHRFPRELFEIDGVLPAPAP